MKNYEETIINLALQTHSTKDYIGDNIKKKVRQNNVAMKKLFALSNELKNNIPQAIMVYSKLMAHPAEEVKLTAASTCIRLKICQKQAEEVLKKIISNSEDPFTALDAKMCLKQLENQ